MLTDFDLKQIEKPLLEWYGQNARVLPWREEVTPYRVWISEIMLQQTRVEAVKPFFERFMQALPTVARLAECPQEQLLKLWEGLGYYNRARNLQTAARQIMDDYQGQLPEDYEELLKLKGIGHYTAGAIASIAYNRPVPAVDGNVLRVIMRVSADDSDIMKQSVKNTVEDLLRRRMQAEDFAGGKEGCYSAFNQALMELGATVCLPNGAPLCEKCPWNGFCRAHLTENWAAYPVKKKAKARRLEDRTVLIIRDGEKVVLQKRKDAGLLAGLYQFPNVDGHLTAEEALDVVRSMRLNPLYIQPMEAAKHIFSHVEWHMIGYMIRVDSLTADQSDLLFADTDTAQRDYPIPAAFRAYTSYLNIRLGQSKFEN